jgi:hypothetical protein
LKLQAIAGLLSFGGCWPTGGALKPADQLKPPVEGASWNVVNGDATANRLLVVLELEHNPDRAGAAHGADYCEPQPRLAIGSTLEF